MQKLIFLIAFSFITLTLQAEDFYILHIKGKISLEGNTNLKPGDKVTSSDKIHFGSTEAMASVMSTKRGRLVLKATKTNSTSELAFMVENIINPSSGKLSSRSGEILNLVDLKLFLEKDNYAIIDSSIVNFSPKALKLDKNHFLFLTYNYKGETINKKLSVTDSSFTISKDIYSIDGKPIEINSIPEMMLMYYNSENNTIQEIALMKPVFINSNSLLEAYSILSKYAPKEFKKNGKITREELQAYIYDNYGFIPQADFTNFCESNSF